MGFLATPFGRDYALAKAFPFPLTLLGQVYLCEMFITEKLLFSKRYIACLKEEEWVG